MEGNKMKMREALELCVKEMCNYCRNEAISRGLELTCVDGCEAYKIAQAALSAPPRNCDVGTPDEQTRRMFEQYCSEQISCYELPSGEHCPLHCTGVDCRLAWAQMPYVAQEGVRE